MPFRPIPAKPVAEPPPASGTIARSDAPAARQRTQPDTPTTANVDVESDEPEIQPYRVGRGKPPLHSRYKPGQSGNPKGRPKAARGLKTITREVLGPKVTVRTAAGEVRMTRIEAVIHKVLEQAMKGNGRAMTQLISLYAAAVPEAASQDQAQVADALTATDEAILTEFRAAMLADGAKVK